jgi:hypothetical protein
MNLRQALGLHSVRVHIATSLLATYLATINEAALPVLNGLPPEMRSKLPAAIGFVLIAIGIAARMLAQPDHPASIAASDNGK